MEFRERKGYTTTDGHRYVSVPTDVPTIWHRTNVFGVIAYSSGEYVITRYKGESSRSTYTVWRDGAELHLSFTGSLKHAKEQAVRNAQGLDFFNWA